MWGWPLGPGKSFFSSWREVLYFLLVPDFPRTIIYISDDNDVEHYYEGEIYVKSGDRSATLALIPRCERDGTKGPRTVHVIGGDPLEKGSLASAFDLPGIRGAITAWLMVMCLVFYFAIYVPGIFLIFSPPASTIEIAGQTVRVIPTDWSPDPLKLGLWILAAGGFFVWILFNLGKFKEPCIKSIYLVEVSKLSGSSICIPAPRPFSSLPPSKMVQLLGKHGPIEFVNDVIKQLISTVTSVIKEADLARAQAISTLEMTKRLKRMVRVEADLSVGASMAKYIAARPFAFILIFALGIIIGAVAGYFIGANFAIQASAPAAAG